MNNKKRDAITRSRVERTAEACGVSPDEVYKVRRGDRDNEVVMTVFMKIVETEKSLKNELVKMVEELVPFEKTYKSATQRKPIKESTAGNQRIA